MIAFGDRNFMRRIIVTTILPIVAGLAMAQAAATEDEIRNAEKSWAAAVTSADYSALEKILADQLIYAHSTGAIESKSEYAGRLRSGAQNYDAIDYMGTTVRGYGDAAVAHSRVRMKGTSNGRPFNDQLMMLHLWVKRGGQWRLAAHQTTKLE